MSAGTTLPEPICLDCSNCSPILCKWLMDNDMSDIIRYKSKISSGSKKLEIISVQECKNFEEGPLKVAEIKDYKMASLSNTGLTI